MSRENGTLQLTWQPPDSPGGTILNYTIQIIPLNDEEARSEVTTTTSFSIANLSKSAMSAVQIYRYLTDNAFEEPKCTMCNNVMYVVVHLIIAASIIRKKAPKKIIIASIVRYVHVAIMICL